MPANKLAAVVVLVIGVGLFVIALLADVVGIGDDAGFGTQQQMGSVAGLVIAGLGYWLLSRYS